MEVKVRYRWCGIIALGMLVLLLLSACGGNSSSTQTGSAQTGKSQQGNPPAKTPLQMLQSSVIAMKQLKTAHFEMTNVNRMTSNSTATSQQATTINLRNSGDLVFPDQISMQLNIGQASASQGLNMAEIQTGQKVYIQNSKGKWFVLDHSAVEAGANPLAGANVNNYNNLLTLAEKARLTDHGTESLNGTTVRHIVASFGYEALHDLLTATGQLNSLPAQQRAQLEQALKNAKLQNPALHLWINESNSYVERMELKFVMNVASSTVSTATAGKSVKAPATPSVTTTSVDTVIDYSKFNVPVKITAPANAVTTTNVSQIFE